MNAAGAPVPAANPGRADFRLRMASLRLVAFDGAGPAAARFLALHAEFDAMALPLRRALLASPLAWTPEERATARWLHRTCDGLAMLGLRLSSDAVANAVNDGDEANAVVAATLFYMGETVKWDVATAADAPHDMGKLHALMRHAMDCGRHRTPMRLVAGGAEADCTVESLYFRVLLLARFASGALNGKQIEILDAWMWLWMPVLRGVPDPPPGTALRADLDSASGLQLGPRESPGPSLYLQQELIEAAYHDVVRQFHAGQIVPATGIASELRIEEHVAVLDLIRRNLRYARREPVPRAPRRAIDATVEVHLGLAEIMRNGFAPKAPLVASVQLVALAGKADASMRRLHERDSALGEIYDSERRMMRLVDESDTGLGLEGPGSECGAVAAGDLLAVRLPDSDRLVLGKVVRSVASKTPGHVLLGVRRMSAGAQLLALRREAGTRPADNLTLLFVPGLDSSGRHDACLVSERDFAERAPLCTLAGNRLFRMRLNRARERGRGWVLAGFEVLSARLED